MTYAEIAARRWGRGWNPTSIRNVHGRTLGALRTSVPRLARWPGRAFEREPVTQYFGITPVHFLHRPVPDWNILLTEPQATRGLAHCIMAHHRSARIVAFLAGLGIDASHDELSGAFVVAEEARVDLLAIWDEGRRGAMVEAKFGHKVTKGQLSAYGKYVRRTYRDVVAPARIVLKLDAGEYVPFKGTQSTKWNVLSWAEFMLRMERALNDDADDDDFRLFRRLVWHRIGGLQQGKR